ncbi:MAG: hypothetical protein H0V62_06075 [Gammaproteobacteria bacterium]|nr:hypothetical protein [Gammaproteobacteria bacterium]
MSRESVDDILQGNSLRDVLIALSTRENIDLLSLSGFSRVEVFFQWYNWSGCREVTAP